MFMFNLHSTDSELCYKTQNIYSETQHPIFFICDPPHLMNLCVLITSFTTNFLLMIVSNSFWSPEYELIGPASFMPISRIVYRCAQVQIHMEFHELSYNNGQTITIIPIKKSSNFE